MNYVPIADFRTRFPALQSHQPFAVGLYASMLRSTDQQRQAEVVLRVMPEGADPRGRTAKVGPDRITQIRHSNVVVPFETLKVEADPADAGSKPLQVSLYLPGQGDPLDQLLKGQISPESAKRIVSGMLDGLEFLHTQGIIHGNLKPSNVLVQQLPQAHAGLCDFGYGDSFDYRNAILQWPSHQLAYLAPEQLAGKTPSFNVDFWPVGLLTYQLFKGQYLFGSNFANNTELVARIEAADFPQDIAHLPEAYRNLIHACLNRDPRLRPATVAQLRDIIAGKIRWEQGKAVPVVQQAPPPQEVVCHSCQHRNPPGTRVCGHCAAPLAGPAFLKGYRRSNARAIWTLIWFGMFMLPIAFFYYGLYQVEVVGAENQDLWDKVTKVIEWYKKVAPDDQGSSYSHSQNGELSDGEKAAVLVAFLFFCYFFVFGSLWMLFQMLWIWRVSNNLEALGSPHRKYHPALMLLSAGVFFVGLLGLIAFPPLALLAFPIASILPLLTLQEVWRGSNPAYLKQDVGWRKAKGSFLVLSWWLLSLVFPILLIMPLLPVEFFLKMGFDWQISLNWFYATIGILVAYCVMYAFMLIRVNYRQARKYRAWMS